MVPRQLLRPKDGHSKGAFCQSYILTAQQSPTEQLVKASKAWAQQAAWKCKLILLREQWNFFECTEFHSFQKNCFWKSHLLMTSSTQGKTQTIRWPWEPIILLIKHFEGSTEVQRNSWWKVSNLWSTRGL